MQLRNSDLISIIVPIYKVEKELRVCVDSILSQTYSNLEIILVNDGSPDRCGEICDEYKILDDRIKVIHKANGGLSDARNAGLDVFTGEYVVFVDSDDKLHHQFIEILYNYREGADLVVCDFQTFFNEGDIYDEILEEINYKDISNMDLLKRLWTFKYPQGVVAWNKLYSKDVWANLRYEFGKIHEDEFIIHHLVYRTKNIRFIEAKLYYYRERENSIMNTSAKDSKSLLHKMEALNDRKIFFQKIGLKEPLLSINNEILLRCLTRSVGKDNLIWNGMTYVDIFRRNKLSWKFKFILFMKKVNFKVYSMIVGLFQDRKEL